MDPDRIDFSPIDPAADSRRWEAMQRSVVARVRPRRTLMLQLAAIWKPALAVSAALALLGWLALPRAERPAHASSAERLLEWTSGAPPSADVLWITLEAGHDQQP